MLVLQKVQKSGQILISLTKGGKKKKKNVQAAEIRNRRGDSTLTI